MLRPARATVVAGPMRSECPDTSAEAIPDRRQRLESAGDVAPVEAIAHPAVPIDVANERLLCTPAITRHASSADGAVLEMVPCMPIALVVS